MSVEHSGDAAASIPETQLLDWQIKIALAALEFFGTNPTQHNQALATIGKPAQKAFTPFSGFDFAQFLGKTGWGEQWQNAAVIGAILRQLSEAGILEDQGSTRESIPIILRRCYLTLANISKAQQSGLLWLAPALGAGFLIPSIGSAVIAITGVNKHGDPRVGTGLLLNDHQVLTCKHVLDDMHGVDDVFEDPGVTNPLSMRTGELGQIQVSSITRHDREDVALLAVDLRKSLVDVPRGLVFRDPRWADRITLFGYPPVPYAATNPLVVNAGEVVNPLVPTLDRTELLLFSATARPGDSGGPIAAADGRIVGMAVRSLQVRTKKRKRERMPFYSALPSGRVRAALKEMGCDGAMTWETWQ